MHIVADVRPACGRAGPYPGSVQFEWNAVLGRDHVDASPYDAQDEGDALQSLTHRTNQIGNNFFFLCFGFSLIIHLSIIYYV